MNLDDMIQLAEDQAKRILLGTREELVPMWMMVTGEGKVEIIATPWAGTEQKHLAIEAMRDVMRKRQVVAYSLLVEAWFAVLPKEEAGREYTGPPPSQRADRKECVVVTAVNHWGQDKHRQWEIIRDKKGRCAELRRLDGPEDKITSALFDNLIESRRPN